MPTCPPLAVVTMITTTLQQIGLDEKEVACYMKLLELGQSRASVLSYQLNYPRTTAQHILNRLEDQGLASKAWQENTYIYTPIHPDELIPLIEARKKAVNTEFTKKIQNLKEAIPGLRMLVGKNKKVPKVKFYRGIEGVRKVLFDTLTSKTELKDFANIDAMFKHAKEINEEYVKEREKTKIKKRSLLLDTPFARKVYESGKYSPKSHKGYKWIPKNAYPFALEMNIYDGKVSYITYVENDFTGVIIENEHIFQMHESIWKLLWDQLPPTH